MEDCNYSTPLMKPLRASTHKASLHRGPPVMSEDWVDSRGGLGGLQGWTGRTLGVDWVDSRGRLGGQGTLRPLSHSPCPPHLSLPLNPIPSPAHPACSRPPRASPLSLSLSPCLSLSLSPCLSLSPSLPACSCSPCASPRWTRMPLSSPRSVPACARARKRARERERLSEKRETFRT